MNKAKIANVAEINSGPFTGFCFSLGDVRYARRWEYPWLWMNGLMDCAGQNLSLLDIGSADSLMPRYLRHGFRVEMIDIDPAFADCTIVKDEHLPFEDATFDWVTSISVIEHQQNKNLAIDEALRVLKPGGYLGITFDFSGEGLDYPWPTWVPLTLSEFEDVVWFRPEFGNAEPPLWNLEDLENFIAWHKATAPHHTYGIAGAVLRKN